VWYDGPMRIAVLADIHGNLAAFHAALAAARREAPDLLVIAGDVVNGAPDSRACWQLAVAEADVLLRGNHERYVLHWGTPEGDARNEGVRFRPIAWAREQVADVLDELRACPIAAALAEDVRVMHAAPADDRVNLYPWTEDGTLERVLDPTPEALLIRAHNHLPFHRSLADGRLLVSVGAVGLALVGRPEAQFGVLTRHARRGWTVRHVSVPYDVDATLARFVDTGYLEAAGPMTRVFRREIATGSHHLVPFVRFERRWREARGIEADDDATLERALRAFLAID
jgi:hypothetical protein